jgi:cyclopropane-fatty-acyl-phospholipid synthase
MIPSTKNPGRMEAAVRDLLAVVDVKIGGDRPWDIRVADPRVFQRVLAGGELAGGETYMEGGWECDRLDQLFERLLTIDYEAGFDKVGLALEVLEANVIRLINPQRRAKAAVNTRHYDAGDDFYEAMLDSRRLYTCGYWKNAKDLESAQEAKLDLACRKLGLAPGMRLLDVGCGWGGLVRFAAERYGVKAVGISVTDSMIGYAKKYCAGLDVEIRKLDYRDLKEEKFDRVVAMGMIEHIGYKNYRTFMERIHGVLADDGMFLLHTIGNRISTTRISPFFHAYIFPNAVIPSIKQIGEATEGLFVMEDWHNFGPDYDPTLMAWDERFRAAWPRLKGKYDETFYRMIRFYLLSCAAVFRVRKHHLWQIAFTKKGAKERTFDAR